MASAFLFDKYGRALSRMSRQQAAPVFKLKKGGLQVGILKNALQWPFISMIGPTRN